jgi:hypothetical protein
MQLSNSHFILLTSGSVTKFERVRLVTPIRFIGSRVI